MKVICLQENLKSSLNIAQNIIGRNLTLPILNNLSLTTENGRLKISSTNLEIGINTWTPGKVEKEGAITCPAKILAGFVNNLPAGKKVELEAKGNNLIVRCENYKANLKGLSADDFPIIPKIKADVLAEIPSENMKASLAQVVGSASLLESRPEITGVLFSLERNNLKLVATDSFRLAEKFIYEASKNNENQSAFIIPQRTIQELIRILGEKDGVLKIYQGNNQILFETQETQLISRLIDGQYPPYERIIPKNFSTSVILNKDEIVNTVRIAGLFSSKVNTVKIIFHNGKLEITSEDPDLGENKSQVTAKTEGNDLEISLNYRFLLEGLGNIQTKQVFLGFNSESTAGVVKPVGDDSFIYLVMPIKNN